MSVRLVPNISSARVARSGSWWDCLGTYCRGWVAATAVQGLVVSVGGLWIFRTINAYVYWYLQFGYAQTGLGLWFHEQQICKLRYRCGPRMPDGAGCWAGEGNGAQSQSSGGWVRLKQNLQRRNFA